jgi:hypothetical protein
MASHYVSLNRGIDGFKGTDFTSGTSSTAADAIELRVLDGASLTRLDVVKAIEAFERYFENSVVTTAAGFDISG